VSLAAYESTVRAHDFDASYRLYMAPEILRYEKYDAKADLWSVGAVLFEMVVGKPPFRASNHVELLRRIEKNEDRIKFPDESSRSTSTSSPQPSGSSKQDVIPASLVSDDIKALIRGLLKRQPGQRMGFEAFFDCEVWDGYLRESILADSSVEEGSGSLSLEVSSDSSAAGLAGSRGRVRELLESAELGRERARPARALGPTTDDPALQPQAAPSPPRPAQPAVTPKPSPSPPSQVTKQPIRRSEPKYFVGDSLPSENVPSQIPTTFPRPSPVSGVNQNQALPRPIQTPAQRRLSMREGNQSGSVEDAQPITPGSNPPLRGSPLAATPPITLQREEAAEGRTGKEDSALEGEDSVVGREYVVVEKTGVVVNSFADSEFGYVWDMKERALMCDE
jgi:serine/threonine-protein kinase ULK/ATG1